MEPSSVKLKINSRSRQAQRLIAELIGRETRTNLAADVKGDIYEGLLQKNAEDVKSGASQYFTPRPLIQAIVDVMLPGPGMRIMDPAAGTGGFLLVAYDYISHLFAKKMDAEEKRALKLEALRGVEIVDSTGRLCAMNLRHHHLMRRVRRAVKPSPSSATISGLPPATNN